MPGRCGSPRKLAALPKRVAQVANRLSQPWVSSARVPGATESDDASLPSNV